MKLQLTTILLSLFAVANIHAAEKSTHTVVEGKLGGCLYKIAQPNNWNKKLLLLAHGGRPEKNPLSADFKIEGTYLEKMLEDGWMVAETSYRRNGIFVSDGVEDLKDLFEFIAGKYGRPGKTYIEGTSMGGKIALQLAEEPKGRFDGVLAIGAALLCDDNGTSSEKNMESFRKHTFRPSIPVLFVSNANEVGLVNEYAALASTNTANTSVWTAVRRGHCNVNDAETRKAFGALQAWVEKGVKPDAESLAIDVRRDKSSARAEQGRLFIRINRVDPAYGNLTADAARSDLEKAGIRQDAYFNAGCKGKTARVFLGYHYADVKKGEWVAFVTAEDYLQIAISWGNAQKELGCTEGDEISLEPESYAKKRP